ncbi:MAG: TIGR03118 family protein, partial [Ginsengibacter sp.]
MNKNQQARIGVHKLNSLLIIILAALSFGCNKPHVSTNDLRNFEQVNLVANSEEYHPVTIDPTLLNAFGIAWSPNGIAWVNSVGGHVSELYNSEGGIVRAPVNIPSPSDTVGGLPTGIVFSGGLGFNLSNGPSLFLFTGFDGVLSGWNPASGNNAKSLRTPPGAAYTGLAIASNHGRNLIYGANFGANRIDVWDTAFSRVTMTFKDPEIPAEYSPYNIQAVGEKLFVMYAQLSLTGGVVGHVAGSGKGFVSVFNTDGSFVKRFASRGSLNIPWGVTLAPASFLGTHDMNIKSQNVVAPDGNDGNGNSSSNSLKQPVILVGNFGDGRINVYSLDAKYLGQLRSHDHTIVIEGLWALSFAPSTATAIDPARLYFSAGP